MSTNEWTITCDKKKLKCEQKLAKRKKDIICHGFHGPDVSVFTVACWIHQYSSNPDVTTCGIFQEEPAGGVRGAGGGRGGWWWLEARVCVTRQLSFVEKHSWDEVLFLSPFPSLIFLLTRFRADTSPTFTRGDERSAVRKTTLSGCTNSFHMLREKKKKKKKSPLKALCKTS